jgi:hypothetical protein
LNCEILFSWRNLRDTQQNLTYRLALTVCHGKTKCRVSLPDDDFENVKRWFHRRAEPPFWARQN